MNDQDTNSAEGPEAGATSDRQESGRSRRERMSEGIRQGIGVLSAFKEALEETIQEARDRGDLSTDRAKEVMREALDRAQSAAEDAKEKLDFAHQSELERARGDLDALQAAFEALQLRVSALEQEVFAGGDSDDAEGE